MTEAVEENDIVMHPCCNCGEETEIICYRCKHPICYDQCGSELDPRDRTKVIFRCGNGPMESRDLSKMSTSRRRCLAREELGQVFHP